MSTILETHDEVRLSWSNGMIDGPFETVNEAQGFADNFPGETFEVERRTVTTTATTWARV